MSLLKEIQENPVSSGISSTICTMFISVIGILSEESTVRFIGSIGGLLGIILTGLSIYYLYKKNNK